MSERTCPWFMRLTMQNTQTGRQAFVMYPSDQYEIFDSMARCGIPYGAGHYSHLAVSYNGVEADSLQEALTDIIEHPTRTPSIQEFNELAAQIQNMTDTQRIEYERGITVQTDGTIVEAINLSYSTLGRNAHYDGVSMADRAVLFGEEEPYLKLQLIDIDDKSYEYSEDNGVWVALPASEEELKAAANSLGCSSYDDLGIGAVTGFLGIDEDALEGYTIQDFNRYAKALQSNGIVKELAKFKAVVSMETCYDLHLVTDLAQRLDDYEFHIGASLEQVGGTYRGQYAEWDDCEELAEYLGYENTSYGTVKLAESQGLEQTLQL